jgi:adenosylmethionine-8-amino-7-oxononanoate aminotransferase
MKRDSPVWHPFTQHALQPDAPEIARGEGAWLVAADGQRIFDAISSWWVITHGHCHPRIVQAIREQAAMLDQVIFAGYTHEPAEKLARKLISIAPQGLTWVFFSDSGSTAVEVAVKMALGYFRHRNEPRVRVLALESAYHGDTIGAMAMGARGVFNAPYEPLLFEVGRIPFPEQDCEQQTLDALEAACRSKDVAAFIVEPLILGAGGMRVYRASVLVEMRAICARYGTLFIADEVMTGWGRTGTRFACEQANIVPDIACYAKGLTGGSLPLAVTLCREEIFQAHYAPDRARMFFHSSSYTANPIACAAALANLAIWDEEPVLERIASIADGHRAHLARLANHPRFGRLRQCGTIAALDWQAEDAGYLADIGPMLYQFFQTHHVLLRPLGNTIYMMPPYCTTADELAHVYALIEQTAETLR